MFIELQITDHCWFIARMHDEIRTSTNLISQLNALITELEAFGDYEEVFGLVMELQDDRRDEQDKVANFNRLIVVVEEKIHGKEIDLEMLEVKGNDGYLEFSFECEAPLCLSVLVVRCASGIMETQAIDDQDPLVNYDNYNENDDLGYQSEEYFDEVKEDDENNRSNGNVVKRGITSQKAGNESSWSTSKEFHKEIETNIHFSNQNTLLKLNEVSAKYSASLQAEEWVNFVNTRPQGIQETDDKIKEGTLKVDHGTEAMIVVLGKEKGGGSGDVNPINSNADEEGKTKIHRCEIDASIQKSNGLETLKKEIETR
nr:hypothetical protein [Tanacetum cinerariifolium]